MIFGLSKSAQPNKARLSQHQSKESGKTGEFIWPMFVLGNRQSVSIFITLIIILFRGMVNGRPTRHGRHSCRVQGELGLDHLASGLRSGLGGKCSSGWSGAWAPQGGPHRVSSGGHPRTVPGGSSWREVGDASQDGA